MLLSIAPFSGDKVKKSSWKRRTCDFDQYPYKVNTYARQLIVRESSLTVRSLVTSCRLLNATRSDNNPHGFIIEAFTITENKDLQTIKR